MRKRCFLALLAAACMAVGCTNDLEEVTSEEVAQENELKLVFSSSTNGEIYPKSRAIATAEENAIENLTVYVFSSAAFLFAPHPDWFCVHADGPTRPFSGMFPLLAAVGYKWPTDRQEKHLVHPISFLE